MKKTYKITVQYEGTRFRGWQSQNNTRNTVQDRLIEVFSRVAEQKVDVQGASRTDAGVHAYAQVAHFKADLPMDPLSFIQTCNGFLPADICITSITEVHDRFHARLNAKGKTYVYRLWNGPHRQPLTRAVMAYDPTPMDIEAMRAGARALIGTHDFSAFCTKPHGKHSNERTITALEIRRFGDEIRFTISGTGFLYNMVRIIVGTLTEIGMGKRSAAEIPALLRSGVRAQAGPTMPPEGLTLLSVNYE